MVWNVSLPLVASRSGWNCTAAMGRLSHSMPSITPSVARALMRSPRPSCFTAWWWVLFTAMVSLPNSRCRREPGTRTSLCVVFSAETLCMWVRLVSGYSLGRS